MHTSNFMKIRPVGAEMFHVDGQTDMTKLMHPKTKHILQISLMRNRLEMDAQHDGTFQVHVTGTTLMNRPRSCCFLGQGHNLYWDC